MTIIKSLLSFRRFLLFGKKIHGPKYTAEANFLLSRMILSQLYVNINKWHMMLRRWKKKTIRLSGAFAYKIIIINKLVVKGLI